MSRALSFAFLLGLAPILASQTATYAKFGKGCPGSVQKPYCAANNPTAKKNPMLLTISTAQEAIEVKNGSPSPVVIGMEFLTRSLTRAPQTITIEVYLAAANGKPLTTPAATGKMTVGATVAWYKGKLSKPLIVKPGKTFFLSYIDPGKTRRTIANPLADRGTKSVNYVRSKPTARWNGPYSNRPWAYKVLCTANPVAPELGFTGRPVIGKPMTVSLSFARANSPTTMITGFSSTQFGAFKLPLDLTPLGATSCSLLVSYDLASIAKTSSAGTAQFSFTLPNDRSILGARFYNQWFVYDPSVNTLQLVFSNGGVGAVGAS